MSRPFSSPLQFGLILAVAALTGCAANFNQSAPAAITGTEIHGIFHGGQAPVQDGSIYLYAASTAGYGSANASLLDKTKPGVATDTAGNGYVVSDEHGMFDITGDYACPSADTLVYLIGAAGNPGLGPGQSNPMIAMIALLGKCGNLPAQVAINELTTVASIEAVTPFISASGASGSIATSPNNVLGLQNAFATANNLVNMSTGVVNTTTPSGLGTIPVTEINTLADILAACVNSDGTDAGCTSLVSATTPAGYPAAPNTLVAMLYIALFPAQSTSLYTLPTADSPYQPTLTAGYNPFTNTYTGQPNDWTIAITYTSSSLTNNTYLAIDSQSNVWVSAANQTVVQLSNAGAVNYTVMEPLAPGRTQLSTQNYDQDLAIDEQDNLWVDNNSYGVSEVTKAGALVTPDSWGYEPFGSGYLRGFGGLAIDSGNNLWIGSAANDSSQLVESDSSGTGLSSYPGGGIVNPIFVAVDPTGNIWTANQGGSYANPNTVTELNPSTGLFLSGAAGFSVGGISTPSAIAFDDGGNAWIANYGGNSLTELTPAGAAVAGSPFTGGGLKAPSDVAIDGVGNVWVSNWASSGVSEFNGTTGAAITPSLGYYRGVNGGDQGSVAIDSSGNVWTSSFGNYVSELVGVAAPTTNPISVATKNKTIGKMP